MNKIAFVILNYCTLHDTIECIVSIKEKVGTENYKIIVVDNSSSDKSGELLKEQYRQDNKVMILQNNSNLGFAKGNNVGIQYAKNILKCNYIVCLNSDTILLSNNFFRTIEEEYLDSSFAVLGPQIRTINNKATYNPGRNTIMSQREIQSLIRRIHLRLILNKLHIEPFYNNILKIINRFVNSSDNIILNPNKRYENVVLHGCCLIFSPIYIACFNGFNEKTFLFMEEHILFTELMIKKMKTVYNPNLIICHKEDGSTNSIFRKNILKRRFIYENTLQSAMILKNIISKLNN